MKLSSVVIATLLMFFISSPAQAAMTELGLSYNYKKSVFDEQNYIEQQASTASISLYFWERVALELSYTNGLFVKKELQPNISEQFIRTTTQYSDIYEGGLILVFADRKASWQPFIKGGVAQIERRQVVQDGSNTPWELKYSGMSPSYGVGIKYFITEAFAIRASYDVLKTPTDGGTHVDDITGRAGISWMF